MPFKGAAAYFWINFGQPLEPSPISVKDEMSKWKQKDGKKKKFFFLDVICVLGLQSLFTEIT